MSTCICGGTRRNPNCEAHSGWKKPRQPEHKYITFIFGTRETGYAWGVFLGHWGGKELATGRAKTMREARANIKAAKPGGTMSDIKSSPEYRAYHRRVVEACVELMGEDVRRFFDEQCDYLEEFLKDEDPIEIAENQLDSM